MIGASHNSIVSRVSSERPASARDLSDWLIGEGRHWVTLSEAEDLLQLSPAAAASTLSRLRRKGLIFSPTSGAYVPVPPEYRSWGGLPASHWIDAFMKYLDHPYYVGFLSAAEIFSVAHQHPQVFQVVTTSHLRNRSFGRVSVQFIINKQTEKHTIRQINTPTGTMRVSVPEVTALDLVASPVLGAGISNVCTILGEMIEEDILDLELLAETSRMYPAAVRQRTGWMLDFAASVLDVEIDLKSLHAAADLRTVPAVLRPTRSRLGGKFDKNWNIIINAAVEPDL